MRKAYKWKEKRLKDIYLQKIVKAHKEVFLDCGECVSEVL
jgi:hypothetical protein